MELWTGQIEGERLVNHTKTAKPVTWHSVCEQALFRSTNQLAAPSPGGLKLHQFRLDADLSDTKVVVT